MLKLNYFVFCLLLVLIFITSSYPISSDILVFRSTALSS